MPPKPFRAKPVGERHPFYGTFWLSQAPEAVLGLFENIHYGFVARSVVAVGITSSVVYGGYSVWYRYQQTLPLAKRWNRLLGGTPCVVIDKYYDGEDIQILRLKLPNSHDYAGYDPVSAVQLRLGDTGTKLFFRGKRWFNPVSPPDARGYIELAIRDHLAGIFYGDFARTRVGDVVYLHAWMKEFRYEPNTYESISLIAGAGSASVALQMMAAIDSNPKDKTQLRVMYFHPMLTNIPFQKSRFRQYVLRNPDRIKVQHHAFRPSKGWEGSYGSLTAEILKAFIAPPSTVRVPTWTEEFFKRCIAAVVPESWSEGTTRDAPIPGNRRVLVSINRWTMDMLCGHSFNIENRYYIQPPRYRYSGIMQGMGYNNYEIYRFA